MCIRDRYEDGETVTMTGGDGSLIEGTVVANSHGMAKGFHKSNRGFLNEDKYIHDNEFFDLEKSRSILTAYNQTRALCEEEVLSLPVLIRGSAIRFLLTRLYDWLNHPEDALVKPKDPMSYLKKLRFHQQITDASSYGAKV